MIGYNASVYEAAFRLMKNRTILFVVDFYDRIVGVISKKEMNKAFVNEALSAEDICNKNYTRIYSDEDEYAVARNIFGSGVSFKIIPIIDKNQNLIDIMSYNRAYYKTLFMEGKLPRRHYAFCVWKALLEAKALGYKSISVIEFGVAGGSGLRNLEYHAIEASNIHGIETEIYGFDWGDGLHETNCGYKDLQHLFPKGGYCMGDKSGLENRLRKAKLIIGDIKDTANTFINNYHPSPIGAIMIDVDYYSSTCDILKFIESLDKEMLLPRVYLYFDDLRAEYEMQGEDLAIKEFNNRNDELNISSESRWLETYWGRSTEKLKVLNVFKHSLYNTSICKRETSQLPFIDTL